MDRRPLIAAAACAGLAALVYAATMHVGIVQRADIRLFDAFVARDGARGTGLAPTIFNLFDPVPFAFMVGALVLGAMLAGRHQAGVVIGVAILGATLTSEVLKRVLSGGPEFEHSWPSGHTTAVLSLVFGLLLLSPPRWRWFVAAGGALVSAGVMVSMLVLGSHYPSDVAGGVLVAATYSCLAGAVLSGSVLAPTAARPRLRSDSLRARG